MRWVGSAFMRYRESISIVCELVTLDLDKTAIEEKNPCIELYEGKSMSYSYLQVA